MSSQAWYSHTIGTFVGACGILLLAYALWRQISYQNPPGSYSLLADFELAILITLVSQFLLWVAVKLWPDRKAFRMAFHLIALGASLDGCFYFRTVAMNPRMPSWLQNIETLFSSEWQFSRFILM